MKYCFGSVYSRLIRLILSAGRGERIQRIGEQKQELCFALCARFSLIFLFDSRTHFWELSTFIQTVLDILTANNRHHGTKTKQRSQLQLLLQAIAHEQWTLCCDQQKNRDFTLVVLRKWNAQLMLGEKNIGQRSIVEGPRHTSIQQQPMPTV